MPKKKKQVITIRPGGSIESLMYAPDKGVDIKSMGKAKIKRFSEVLFDEDIQKFYIRFLQGPYAGQTLKHWMYMEVQMAPDYPLWYREFEFDPDSLEDTMYFDGYHIAVDHEIDFYNSSKFPDIDVDELIQTGKYEKEYEEEYNRIIDAMEARKDYGQNVKEFYIFSLKNNKYVSKFLDFISDEKRKAAVKQLNDYADKVENADL